MTREAKDVSDSWEDYADDVSVGLDQLAVHLEEQLRATEHLRVDEALRRQADNP